MAFLWLLVGFVIGVAVIWFWVKRRVDEQTASIEASYEGRLQHLQAEVGRADQAHEETKEALRALQAEKVAAEERAQNAEDEAGRLRAQVDAAKAALDQLEARLKGARLAEPPAAAAPAPAAAEPGAATDERARRLRSIDAKLKMLPAGSSAGAALLAERRKLLGDGPVPELPTAPAGSAPDDLEAVKGIGPVIDKELKSMGIVTFAQLAALTPAQVERIEERIGFPGRVEREQWIAQARKLMARGS
jgi:NADH-quinone oxidoreductase subunit E